MSNNELTRPAAAVPQEPTLTPRSAAGLTTRVMRGSLWNLGGQGVTMLATLIATPFVIRLLGPERYGVLALINVMIGYLSFADLGMGWASTRFASEAHARGEDKREAATVWTALFLAAGPALLVALTLALGARPLVVNLLRLPTYLQEAGILAMRFAALGFFGRAFALILNTPEIVRLRMDLLVLINVGTLVVQIFLIPIVLYSGGGLVEAAAIIAGVAVVCALLHFVVGTRLLAELRRPRVDLSLLPPLSKFGLGVMLTSLTTMLFSHADKLFITRFASVRALAYYSVAFNFSILLSQVPLALGQALLPAFSQLQAHPERTALHELYGRALRGTLFWVVPAAVFLCVIARPFFSRWAGPDFGRESTLPFYLLALGLIFEVMVYVPHTLLMAIGRSHTVARCQFAVLIPYLISSAIAIRWYGAVGAAAAWSLRAMVVASVFALVVKRVSGLRFSPLPKNAVGYFATLAVLLLPVVLVYWLTPAALPRIAVALVALAAYSSLILRRFLTSEERNWILGKVFAWRTTAGR